MKRDLAALANDQFDLAIIGGGMSGACAAWDAALRGLSVALIEREDFGGATSANSFKIVHGGIRYLQHADVPRIRESSAERRVFLCIAPHLVQPLPIAIPTYGHGMRGKAVLRAGMAVYDLLTADRNRGVPDSHRIPPARFIGREEALSRFPGLPGDGLTGAAIFCDGQFHNPPRLVFAFLQSAVGAGAVVANYVEATGFIRDGDRVTGIQARDVLGNQEIPIRAKVVLNAAGPYAEALLERSHGLRLDPPGTYSRDACFVVARRLLPGSVALAVQGSTRDPDARFSRGERHLFLVPWRDFTLVGTWHKVHSGNPDRFTVTEAELAQFIREVNAAYPPLNLSLDDVALWNAGLVPFGENPAGATHLRYGHRSRLVDHAQTHGIHNLLTLISVRLTVGRRDAIRAIDLAYRKLGRNPPPSLTHRTRLAGAELDSVEDFVREERIRHAIREEMAQTLGDVVFRRTDMGTGSFPGLRALRETAEIMAAELGWSAERTEREIAAVVGRFPGWTVERSDATAPVRQ